MPRIRTTLVLALVILAVHECFGAENPDSVAPKPHDFGERMLMVRMRTASKDGRFSEGYLDQASVRLIGQTAFLVGVVRQSAFKPIDGSSRGPALWLPLADVAEMAEFDDGLQVQNAREAAENSPPLFPAANIYNNRLDMNDIKINSRGFTLPFRGEKDRLKKAILFQSRDEGKSWQRVAESDPESGFFHVSVAEDGRFWFAVQAIDKDGRKFPEVLEGTRPNMIVTVRTGEGDLMSGKPTSLEGIPTEFVSKTDFVELKTKFEDLQRRLNRLEEERRKAEEKAAKP